VGVGDGDDPSGDPTKRWSQLVALDDLIPGRLVDNLQVCILGDVLTATRDACARAGVTDPARLKDSMEASFAVNALMEVPQQFKAWSALKAVGVHGTAPKRAVHGAIRVLEPPVAAVLGAGAPTAAATGGGGAVAAAGAAAGPASYLSMQVLPPAAAAAAAAPGPASTYTYGGGAPTAAASVLKAPPVMAAAVGVPISSHVWQCSVCGNQQLYADAFCTACARSSAPPPPVPLPPSTLRTATSFHSGHPSAPPGYLPPATAPPADAASAAAAAATARELERLKEERCCPVCLEHDKDTAFDCGHQTCGECASRLTKCPVCRAVIAHKIRLYS